MHFAYSTGLVLAFLAVVALGLFGLPMTSVILFAFAAAIVGAFAYAVWEVLAHRGPRRPVH